MHAECSRMHAVCSRMQADPWVCMQSHKLACSYMSLHAVTWACMQFPELSWSSMSLHEIPWACIQSHGLTNSSFPCLSSSQEFRSACLVWVRNCQGWFQLRLKWAKSFKDSMRLTLMRVKLVVHTFNFSRRGASKRIWASSANSGRAKVYFQQAQSQSECKRKCLHATETNKQGREKIC